MVQKEIQSAFRFRRHMNIGEADAELDKDFLLGCFEDIGDLERLRDANDRKRIIVGRTGSGKSGLLLKLKEEEPNVIWIEPESLSLQYLSNSTLITQLDELGVNLDRFFKLLWKHIFITELVKAKFPMESASDQVNVLGRIRNMFGSNRKKERAWKYLEDWGDSFFETTQYRVKEITQKFESELKASLGAKSGIFDASAGGSAKLAEEDKVEVIHKAQEIVNSTQVAELTELFNILREDFFADPSRPLQFLLIDRLDEGWVEDNVRYRLIRALIETVKDFVHIRGVKIVIALRKDLIDRVFRLTKNPGTQEEKFESLYLKIQWNAEHLLRVLDKRVNALVARKYTTLSVSWADLMPINVKAQKIDEYLIERTLYRPRDIITFFNICIAKSEGQPKITTATLRDAEADYSESRFRALVDEWRSDFPDLEAFKVFLKEQPPSFKLESYDLEFVTEKCLEIAARETSTPSKLTDCACKVAEGNLHPLEFCKRLASVFFQVGLVGLKTERFESARWSFVHGTMIQPEEISGNTSVVICPAFYRYLGVSPTDRS